MLITKFVEVAAKVTNTEDDFPLGGDAVRGCQLTKLVIGEWQDLRQSPKNCPTEVSLQPFAQMWADASGSDE